MSKKRITVNDHEQQLIELVREGDMFGVLEHLKPNIAAANIKTAEAEPTPEIEDTPAYELSESEAHLIGLLRRRDMPDDGEIARAVAGVKVDHSNFWREENPDQYRRRQAEQLFADQNLRRGWGLLGSLIAHGLLDPNNLIEEPENYVLVMAATLNQYLWMAEL